MAIVNDTENVGVWSNVAWPWPKVYFTKYHTLAITLDNAQGLNGSLFELVNDGTDWTAYHMLSLGNLNELKNFSVASFGLFYMYSAVYQDNEGTISVSCGSRLPAYEVGDPAAIVYNVSPNIPNHMTCCNFRGVPVVGGLVTSDTAWSQLGRCSVAWSAIGRVNFKSGDGNTFAGSMVMDWDDYGTGLVYDVRHLGDYVIVYGNGGIAALFLASDPIPTFGKKNLWDFGLLSPRSIAGNEHMHCYITGDYHLWVVNNKLEFTDLGYKEIIKSMVKANIVISYASDRFYISDGLSCYVLNKYGLFSCHQMVTSAGYYRGSILCGFCNDNQDTTAMIVTDILDFGSRDFKTLSGLEIGANKDVTVAFDWKVKNRDSFQRTSWITASDEGYVGMPISGTDFRIAIKTESYVDFKLDSLDIKYKYSGRRFSRGQRAY